MKLNRDRRITIRALNYETEYLETVGEVWAHYRSLSMKEQYEAGVDSGVEHAYFTFVPPDGFGTTYDLDTHSQIIFNNNLYNVVAVDFYEGKPGATIRVTGRRR